MSDRSEPSTLPLPDGETRRRLGFVPIWGSMTDPNWHRITLPDGVCRLDPGPINQLVEACEEAAASSTSTLSSSQKYTREWFADERVRLHRFNQPDPLAAAERVMDDIRAAGYLQHHGPVALVSKQQDSIRSGFAYALWLYPDEEGPAQLVWVVQSQPDMSDRPPAQLRGYWLPTLDVLGPISTFLSPLHFNTLEEAEEAGEIASGSPREIAEEILRRRGVTFAAMDERLFTLHRSEIESEADTAWLPNTLRALRFHDLDSAP